MVLRLGRYTFDRNASPRPQLRDESGGQLIRHLKFSGVSRVAERSLALDATTGHVGVTALGVRTTVGTLPDAVVSARQALTAAAEVLLGTHHQFGEGP